MIVARRCFLCKHLQLSSRVEVLRTRNVNLLRSTTNYGYRYNKSSTLSTTTIRTRPPFVIRVALVGVTVGAATPLLAIAGVIQLWFRVLPNSFLGGLIRSTSFVVIGGGIAALCNRHVIPFLANNSDIILPFAVCNTIVSSTYYALGEYIFGYERMVTSLTTMPVIDSFKLTNLLRFLTSCSGIGIGILTAITAPLLWSYAIDFLCHKPIKELVFFELNRHFFTDVYYSYILGPVALPISVMAGLSIHLCLSPFLRGFPSVPYSRSTVPLLTALSAMSFGYYAFMKKQPQDMYWEKRRDAKTNAIKSINPYTHQEAVDDGILGNNASKSRNLYHWLSFVYKIRKYVTFSSASESSAAAMPSLVAATTLDTTGMYMNSPVSLNIVKGENDDASLMIRRADLIEFLDVLLRYKYLSLQQEDATAAITSDIKRLAEFIAKTYTIDDIRSFVLSMEHAYLTDDITKRNRLLLNLSQRHLSRNQKLYELVSTNLDFIASEYSRELGYELSVDRERIASQVAANDRTQSLRLGLAIGLGMLITYGYFR